MRQAGGEAAGGDDDDSGNDDGGVDGDGAPTLPPAGVARRQGTRLLIKHSARYLPYQPGART